MSFFDRSFNGGKTATSCLVGIGAAPSEKGIRGFVQII